MGSSTLDINLAESLPPHFSEAVHRKCEARPAEVRASRLNENNHPIVRHPPHTPPLCLFRLVITDHCPQSKSVTGAANTFLKKTFFTTHSLASCIIIIKFKKKIPLCNRTLHVEALLYSAQLLHHVRQILVSYSWALKGAFISFQSCLFRISKK